MIKMNRNIILVIAGGLFLCSAGLNNKFPFLVPGSGEYISSGFTKDVPFDRTIMYGLFVAHSSWGISLWLTIFTQAALLSLVLYYFFRSFSNNRHFVVFYLSCLFFVTSAMSASLAASSIAPDVFAGVAILCAALLLFAGSLCRRDYYIVATLLVVSIGMDVSYLITIAFLVFASGLALLFTIKGRTSTNARRISIMGLLVITGWLMVSTLHFALKGGFGMVRDHKIVLLPLRKDAQTVINDFYHQVVNIGIGKYSRPADSSQEVTAIYKWYNDEMRKCYISGQMNGWLNLHALGVSQIVVVILCLLIFIPVILNKVVSRHRVIFAFILFAFIMHAFISAWLYGRYNVLPGRIAWLLSVPVFLYLSEAGFLNKWFQRLNNSFNKGPILF